MKAYFVDLHVHIGAAQNHGVKMAASHAMTLAAVARESVRRKGMDIVGVIDAICPPVQADIDELLADGTLTEAMGGLVYRDADTGRSVTLLLGGEIETSGPRGGAAHFGVWFSGMTSVREMTAWLRPRMRNVNLSSQRLRASARELQDAVRGFGGLFIVNHAFTPHKGLYGNCVERLADMVDPDNVSALELGLSADSDMADRLAELQDVTFVSNSDAHSTNKIAREYNQMALEAPSFQEVAQALARRNGRRIAANYGLRPQLGKYHRRRCFLCEESVPAPLDNCPRCGSRQITGGVSDRIGSIADYPSPKHPAHRPPYIAQTPLEFLPGLGTRTMDRLLGVFGTEMTILHEATEEALAEVIGVQKAALIVASREGRLETAEGGAGRYGTVHERS